MREEQVAVIALGDPEPPKHEVAVAVSYGRYVVCEPGHEVQLHRRNPNRRPRFETYPSDAP